MKLPSKETVSTWAIWALVTLVIGLIAAGTFWLNLTIFQKVWC
jgi:hypothetical protein